MNSIAFDSNVLAYLAGVETSEDDPPKIAAARSLYARLEPRSVCVAPQQALGELFIVCHRFTRDRDRARTIVAEFKAKFVWAASTEQCFANALDLATDHKLQFWDSLILATAADAGCGLLLSEDMQDGFEWHGVTVADPFAAKPHRKLARVLG